MNIMFVSAYDAPRGQSARNYLFARGLADLGHDVTFITNGFNHFTRVDKLKKWEWYRVEMIDGIRTIWVKTIPYKSNGLDRILNMLSNAIMCFLFHTKSQIKPDLVIGPSVPPFTAFSGYLISKMHGARFVFEIRDPWPEILIEMGSIKEESLISKVFYCLSGFLYRECDLIITTLNNVNSILDRARADHSKSVHILNPIEVDQSRLKDNGNKELNTLSVAYVGGFGSGQDIETMLEAASKTKDKKIFFKFVGAPQDQIDALRSKYASANIEICPVVSKSEVHDILSRSTILMSAHKNDGAFKYGINSNKLHDYLAAGKPIIFSGNAPGNPVELSGGGVCVEPENPDLLARTIEMVARMSHQERIAIGERGFNYAKEHLDVRRLTLRLEKIFENLVNKGKAGA